MNINVGAISCGIFGALFLLLGVVFAALGERGVRFISGFGSLPPEKRKLYDTERNGLFIWMAVFAAGAVLSLLAVLRRGGVHRLAGTVPQGRAFQRRKGV